jgi:hypothetical protein
MLARRKRDPRRGVAARRCRCSPGGSGLALGKSCSRLRRGGIRLWLRSAGRCGGGGDLGWRLAVVVGGESEGLSWSCLRVCR